MTAFYLAARYSRREELNQYADQLVALGHQVTSRWLAGNHQISDAGLSEEGSKEERERFAQEDWADVMAADTVIAFTEPPRSTASRGGRHVEFGIAIGAHKGLAVVGPRENVFHCLGFVPQWDTFDQYMQHLELVAVPA